MGRRQMLFSSQNISCIFHLCWWGKRWQFHFNRVVWTAMFDIFVLIITVSTAERPVFRVVALLHVDDLTWLKPLSLRMWSTCHQWTVSTLCYPVLLLPVNPMWLRFPSALAHLLVSRCSLVCLSSFVLEGSAVLRAVVLN